MSLDAPTGGAGSPPCPAHPRIACLFVPESVMSKSGLDAHAGQDRLLEAAIGISPIVEDGRAVAKEPESGVGVVRLDARGLGRLHASPRALLAALVRSAEQAGFPEAVATLADHPFTASVLARALHAGLTGSSREGARARPGAKSGGGGVTYRKGRTSREIRLEFGGETRGGQPGDEATSRCLVCPHGADRRALAPIHLRMLRAPEEHGLPENAIEQLEILSVRTAGGLAALPASAMEKRFGAEGLRLHRLARADDGRPLHVWRPNPPIERRAAPEPPIVSLPALLGLLRSMVEPFSDDLRRAGRGLTRLEAVYSIERSGELRRELEILDAMDGPRSWLRLLELNLEASPLPGPVTSVTLRATETSAREKRPLELFSSAEAGGASSSGHPRGDAASELAGAAARLRARFGEARVGVPVIDDHHRPEAAFHIEPSLPFERSPRRRAPSRPRRRDPNPAPAISEPAANIERPPCLTLRIVTPRPVAVDVDTEGRPSRVDGEEATCAGPFPASGEWWTAPYDRVYFEVAAGDELLWLYRDAMDGRWYLHGSFD